MHHHLDSACVRHGPPPAPERHALASELKAALYPAIVGIAGIIASAAGLYADALRNGPCLRRPYPQPRLLLEPIHASSFQALEPVCPPQAEAMDEPSIPAKNSRETP